MLESILVELLVQSGVSLAQVLLRNRRDFISKAIEDTTNAFPQIETLRESLTVWCDSELFRRLLQKLESGERDLTEEHLLSSFIETSNFYHGEDTQQLASEILLTFFRHLVDQLYQGSSGPTAHAQREEVLHARTRETVVREHQATRQEISQFRSEFARWVSPEDAVRPIGGPEEILHARIDEARTLLDRGKPVTARALLERVKQEISSQPVSAEVRFRVATNLGACSLLMEDLEVAEKEFQSALLWAPENPKALANAAVVALGKGRPDEALDLASRAWEHTKAPYTAAVYMQCLAHGGKRGDIEGLLSEEWIMNDAVCTLALGKLAHEENDYGKAEGFLRRSLAIDGRNPQAMSLLALCLLEPIRRAYAEDPPLPWRLNETSLSALAEAEGLLTHAIDHFEQHEARSLLVMALTNRAVVYGFIGKFDDASKDYDRVLLESGQQDVALRNKGMLLLRTDRPQEAISAFQRVVSPQERMEIQFALAQAYVELAKYPEAAAVLRQQWNPSSRDRRQILIGGLLMHALVRAGQDQEIDAIREWLRTAWPHDPEAMSMLAHQLMREGKATGSQELLREALANSKGNERDRIAFELAESYYRSRQYGEAAKTYGQVVNDLAPTDVLERYVTSLYNAGMLSDALTTARRLRSSRGITAPLIAEVEALVLQYIGDLKGARLVLEDLARLSQDVLHAVSVLEVEIRLGDREAAAVRLGRITYEQIQDNPEGLLRVARARVLLGQGDALPLVYRARRIAFDDPGTHLAYVGFFLSRDPKDIPTVDEVAVDSTVYLEGENEEGLALTILDQGSGDKSRGEILVSDPVASRLLGKRLEDVVSLKQTKIEERTYRVKDIQSKYVHAFRETLTNFGAWFPNHPGLHRVKFQDNDFSKIFAVLDSRHELMMHIRRTYQARQLTLGAIAQLLDSSIVEVWGGMISWKDEWIIASSGEPERLFEEAQRIGAAEGVAIDLVALLTLGYLELLDRLPKRFHQIIVGQPTLDEINEALTRNYLGVRASGTIWKEDGQYFRRDITEEGLKHGRAFLEGLRSFLETTANLVPVTHILKIGRQPFDEFQKILGASSAASILIAREYGVPLYSDDLGLRSVAQTEWGVAGAWTQVVLADMRERGIITQDEYCEAVVRLVLANYRFVSIDSTTLLWLLRKNNAARTEEVERVFGLLGGPECNEVGAVAVIADLLRAVWLDGFLDHQRLWIVDFSLNTLVTGRSARRVLASLRTALEQRLALMPLALKPILESMEIWQRQALLRSGRITRP